MSWNVSNPLAEVRVTERDGERGRDGDENKNVEHRQSSFRFRKNAASHIRKRDGKRPIRIRIPYTARLAELDGGSGGDHFVVVSCSGER